MTTSNFRFIASVKATEILFGCAGSSDTVEDTAEVVDSRL